MLWVRVQKMVLNKQHVWFSVAVELKCHGDAWQKQCLLPKFPYYIPKNSELRQGN